MGIARLGQREIAPIVQTLSEHVGDPAWREVALLTIGYLGIVQQWEEVASDVVTALLDRRPGEPGQAAVWVGDAVVDAWPGGVTPGCKEGVIQALIQVMAADERVQPAQRALAGDTLARLGDPRPDVGLRADGLPDIAWCEVPGGPFWMDDRGQRTLPTFWIGKYPITNAQYAAFGEDEGYTDRWRSCWTDAGWSWKRDRAGPET